jgi:hypothetical protein
MMIPPGSFLELQPGGLHIMLINLKAPLEAGEMLNLVLNFEQAGEVQLAVPIRDMEAMDEAMSEEMSAPAMDMPAVEWDEACQKMHVVDAWARPAVPGMPNSAAYALLLNLTAADDVLTSASTDAAETVELHEMIMGEGDVMQMRPVEGGIAVPAGRATLLKPGGLHVMLIGLTDELAEGTTFDATLTFAESGEIPLTIPVRQPEESGMAGGMGEHGGSEGG